MTSKNNKIINSYLKEVSANLNCKKSLKSVFMKELKSDIENYADSAGLLQKDDLYHEFGAPEEIANSLFNRNDYNILLKRARIKALVWILIAAVLLMLLITAICVIATLWELVHFEVTVTNTY